MLERGTLNVTTVGKGALKEVALIDRHTNIPHYGRDARTGERQKHLLSKDLMLVNVSKDLSVPSDAAKDSVSACGIVPVRH